MLTLVAEDDVCIRPMGPALDRRMKFDPKDRFLSLVQHVAPDIEGWLRSVRDMAPRIPDARVILVSDQAEFLDALPEADAVVTEGLTIDKAALGRAPRLRLVQKFGTNLVNIDQAACSERRIPVRPLRRIQNIAVAEHAFGMMMALAKRLTHVNGLVTNSRLQKAGEGWNKIGGVSGLRGSVLGLIGFGEIAREFAAMAKAFGMTILYTQRNRAEPAVERAFDAAYVPLPDLLARADFVSIHIPLNDSTRHLLDAKALSQAKPGLRLVNTARADIVEPSALLDALHSGRIGAAAFDVLYAEPTTDDDPLLGFDNVLLTPHMAGGSRVNLLTDVENLVRSVEEGLLAR
jgi:D-3-phosphoglycerate dehydrogenase / 2-oxoglutarate reductase